jgi:ribosomal protein L11 methyltransferase
MPRVLRLRVPISGNAASVALERLLAVAPFGVHEREDALIVHAPTLPGEDEMRAALGVDRLEISEVPDTAAQRLAELSRPEPVDGRLLVRAAWMAPLDGVEEVVLADASAFGTGAHPTTRDCLSMLLALPPGGGFADLGCGAGVLAIAAARLGFDPVVAVDLSPRAVRATETNATANDVAIESRESDLLTDPPPPAATAAANVPAEVHAAIAAAWAEPPEHLIVSGVHVDDREAIVGAYAARGLGVVEERAAEPWLTLLLRRGAPADPAGPAAAATAPAPPESDGPEPPESAGERLVELGARATLFDLPAGVRFDVWALDDSLRWALRGPFGTTMEILEETRLPAAEAGEGRPPSTVRIRLNLTTPLVGADLLLHVTVASAGPGLVRMSGVAEVLEATVEQS